jgi:tRNA A-37 threonylcarbamoyl transferase component Bud32/WD40 repeat protein
VTDPFQELADVLADRYRIERRLGEGGMATVYLAYDVRHERQVAVKVLRPELAAVLGHERFLAEIRTTASLQHPNILPLFDSGMAGAVPFYVMPFVEGESLRQRLEREKQLPVGDAVDIATEIAGALDYAHRQGVVHRDIKPENILLQDGRALVADFGIAFAAARAGDPRMTETAVSLGTPRYMSPEQASGERDVTGTTDVFALGVVAYEMLAGVPPFSGVTAQAILANVLTARPPSIREQRQRVPDHVEGAILTALERLPADRFQSAGDFARALEGDPLTGRHVAPARGGSAKRLPWASSLLLVAALGAWGWLRSVGTSAPPRHSVHATIVLPPDRTIASDQRPFDLSSDGTEIVYVGGAAGGTRLYRRPIGALEADPIPGTDGAQSPIFSPDGRWVAFVADGYLQKVPISGGAPIRITPLPDGWKGGSWGENGLIVYADAAHLHRVPEAGGTSDSTSLRWASEGSSPGTGPRGAISAVQWPSLLPDGRHALAGVNYHVSVVDLENGDVKVLFPGRQAVYLPTGHLLYDEGEGRIRIVPFDLRHLTLRGEPKPAFETFRGPGQGAAQFAVARDGTLVYTPGGFDRSLVMVDEHGRGTPLAGPPRGYRFPSFSPDGTHLAVTVDPRPSRIWIVDLKDGSSLPVTNKGSDIQQIWAPDGTTLAFMRGGRIFTFPWPGDDEPRLASPTKVPQGEVVAPDDWGEGGILATWYGATSSHLVLLSPGGPLAELPGSGGSEELAKFSPDGKWIAFVSDVAGTDEIYVRAFPGKSPPKRISTGGGTDPHWSRDGTRIFYRAGSTIMAVPVRLQPTFAPTAPPAALFSGTFDFSFDPNWDVGPDGKFVFVRSGAEPGSRLVVVSDWFDEILGRGSS